MKIEELLREGKEKLIENNIEDVNVIAKVLLEFVLKIDRNELVLKYGQEVEKEKQEEYKISIDKIINGIPLQYIINNQEFMKLNFFVNENVLIPQPDTEILVEEVLKIVRENTENKEDKEERQNKILDMCSGSGCIGISLANYLEDVKVTMSDISKDAIEIAKKNAKYNNVYEKVEFIQSDLFENIKAKEKFDIIVSNPPYIETKVIKNLSKQVQNEPIIALDGGEDGLIFYRKLINEAPKFLNKDGYLCMEIGYDQKEKVINIVKEKNIFSKIEVIKDLSGNDRVVILRK